jgi:hypothetical protein
MIYRRWLVGALLGLLAFCGPTGKLLAQDDDVSDKATRFVGENGRSYLQPAVSVFSANLNSGLYHTADVHDVLGFEIGVVGMFAPIPTQKKTFLAVAPDTIRYNGNNYVVGRDYERYIATSTAVGPEHGTRVYRKQAGPGEPPIYEFPGGLDLKYAPLATPQLTVGLPAGTEFILRYVPGIKLSEDIGKVKFFGVGARHKISRWIRGPSVTGVPEEEELPIDISVHVMYQRFSFIDSAGADFMKTTALSIGAEASKRFLVFTLYGGLAYESASTDISYTYRPKSEYYPEARERAFEVRYNDMKGDNSFRATLGLSLKLVILDLFADYSFGSQPVASAGVLLSIR